MGEVARAHLVRGHCPRGCGETLMVDTSGFVFCSFNKCPQPDAAHILLQDSRKFLAFIKDDSRLLSINPTTDQP